MEDRLALEKKPKLSSQGGGAPTPKPESNPSPSESDSLCSPLFLGRPNPNPPGSDGSGPALDFLSDPETPQEEEEQEQIDSGKGHAKERGIEQLMKLVRLSGEGKELKCEKERRLDEWIEQYYKTWKDGESREPARLTYLLLAKASYSCGSGDFKFPMAIDEFLEEEVEPPRKEVE